ncbi:MAG: sce7726 family protein [Selenomonas noxia]|jgi:hypothetical protein
MPSKNDVLNRFFTQSVFLETIAKRKNHSTYDAVIQHFFSSAENKDNGMLISEIYTFMAKSYRNEYFYQNTLLNKLLLGKHSIKTTTALSQIPIAKSKADFILINGKAVVYEIKTELDSFDRLERQLQDYFKAFNCVCIVTSENQYERAKQMLSNTPVGIYILTPKNTISLKYRKEPTEDNTKLDYTTIFKVLRKQEYENILIQYYGHLPIASQVFYYEACLKQFSKIPLQTAYTLMLIQLKKRNQCHLSNFSDVPYELKSLVYFSKTLKSKWNTVNIFLNQKYGG